MLEAWKKVENSVLSMAAVGLEVDAEASSEAGAACATAAQLMDALFPAVLAALRAGHDEVAAAVVPFLLSYVARLRALQKRGGGADGALPPGQAAHVPAILESLAACARFPDDSAAYEVAASSATERWVHRPSSGRLPCLLASDVGRMCGCVTLLCNGAVGAPPGKRAASPSGCLPARDAVAGCLGCLVMARHLPPDVRECQAQRMGLPLLVCVPA